MTLVFKSCLQHTASSAIVAQYFYVGTIGRCYQIKFNHFNNKEIPKDTPQIIILTYTLVKILVYTTKAHTQKLQDQ